MIMTVSGHLDADPGPPPHPAETVTVKTCDCVIWDLELGILLDEPGGQCVLEYVTVTPDDDPEEPSHTWVCHNNGCYEEGGHDPQSCWRNACYEEDGSVVFMYCDCSVQ